MKYDKNWVSEEHKKEIGCQKIVFIEKKQNMLLAVLDLLFL